jgi:Tol biopolymer transport system component/DNA-binding winged helix-turn-helix (wHTH) protein
VDRRTQSDQICTAAFGPFEFDEPSGRLRKHGSLLRLPGQSLQILSVLLKRPGEIITREELRSHLWGGTTFGDFEQGLNSAVNKLRQTLGDSADQPRYIETVPGRGYRFVAPVQRPSTRAVLGMPAPVPLRMEPRAKTPPQRRLLLGAGAALAAVVVAGGGYWIGSRAREPVKLPQAVTLTVRPPRGFVLEGAATRQSFALSPDGGRLAFTAMDSSGELSVFLRDLNSLEPRLVPGSNGAHTVFWPPDGRTLYFTATGKLWRASLESEARVLLADSPSFMFSGAWLSSKQMLLDSFRASYLISPAGGPAERLNEIYLWPHALPDGQHALYLRWDAKAGRYRAHVLRLSDFSTTRDLMETDSKVLYSPSALTPGAGYLLYVRGGTLLALPFDPRSLRVTGEAMPVASRIYSFAKTGAADFSVSGSVLAYQGLTSRSQLVWVDRTGHEVAMIGPADINVKSARLSPDGQRVATAIYDVERGEQDLWIFEVKTNSGRRLTANAALRDAPVWSPDSKRLAFLSQADGDPPKIHLRGLGVEETEKEMPAADFQMPTDWSPDGRFVAYVNTGFPRTANETQGDVWLLDLTRSGKPAPLLDTRFHEANPAFSPNGKWLAFTSDESGRPELYLQAFETGDIPSLTGERYLVSKGGALAVRWRRDGKELFYLGFDGRVQAVSVRLSPRPEFGSTTPLFTIGIEARAAIHSLLGFDVSLDGNRFVIARALETTPIVVTQNWEALLPHSPTALR